MAFLKRLRTLKSPFICGEGSLSAFKRSHGWSEFDTNAHMMAIKEMHRGFIRSGFDAIKTFAHQNETKYMMDVHKREIEIALEVKAEFAQISNKMDIVGNVPLIAGGLLSHGLYRKNCPNQDGAIKNQYREQLRLFAEYAVDYVTGEAFESFGDAELAINTIKEFNLPCVITVTSDAIKDEWTPQKSCHTLQELGADIIGLDINNGKIGDSIPMLRAVADYLGDDNGLSIAVTSVCYNDLDDLIVNHCNGLRVNYICIKL